MEILKCEDLSKVYGSGASQVIALDKINLSVHKGEFVAIVGASGSGKSTLLHVIGSVDRPTEGRVLIEGRDIAALNPTQSAIFRRRKVGLPYKDNCLPRLSLPQYKIHLYAPYGSNHALTVRFHKPYTKEYLSPHPVFPN